MGFLWKLARMAAQSLCQLHKSFDAINLLKVVYLVPFACNFQDNWWEH